VETGRRLISAVIMAVLMVGGLAATGFTVTTASAAAPQASTYCADGQTIDCIQAPRSLVKGQQTAGEKFTTYCIKNYKGRSVIKIVNAKTGKTISVTTAPNGTACVKVPVTTSCQSISASGPNKGGGPGQSSASVCVTKTTTGSSPPKTTISHIFGGSLPFTGSNIIIPGTILGLILVGIGFFFVLIGRRRRDDDADEATA
jgi:hypothetical protein